MRQAIIAAPDRLALCDAPRPILRGDGEILLRTLACGICSGDLMPWYLAKKVGTVFGHEPVGRAVEVGSAVTHVRPGDLVFAHHHAPCDACDECRRGAHVHCATWKASRLDPGGMAEFVRVPAEIVRADCFAVNDLHPEDALFVEPVGCCVKAFRRCGEVRGRRVAVVGCGVMGLLNVQLALALGAAPVVAVEPDESRRAAAVRLGATEAALPGDAGLRRSCDVVVVGPGHPEVIRQALGYVRAGGVACLFAPTADGVRTELDLGDLYFRDVTLTTSYSCGPRDTREAYDKMRAGLVRPRETVTHRYPLEQAAEAFAAARGGGAAVKVIVTFPEA